jgi:glycosyltransferase involved in cell wall biosynthesis
MSERGTSETVEQRIKLLELSSTDFPFQTFLAGLLDALKRSGYDVTLACSDGPYLPGFRKAGYKVKVLSISPDLNLFHHLVSLVQVYRFIKKEKFDIVHTHTPVAGFIGRLAAALAGTPFIVNTVHGFFFHEATHPVFRRIMVALERFAGRFTHLTFSVSSEDVETAVRERICPRDRIIAIGNGVDLQKFDLSLAEQARRRIREEFGIPQDAPVVGVMGRIVKGKGVVEFVQAMPVVLKARPDARFLIVGDALPSDNDSVKDQIIELVGSLGIQESVIFTGMRMDVPELLAAMDLFVLPSYREGLPVVVLEAMAMAKPVVSTWIRGCREVVVDGETGILVQPRDVPALADAIIRVLSDKDMAHRMGRSGRKRIEHQFELKRIVRKQLDALANLIASTRRIPSSVGGC